MITKGTSRLSAPGYALCSNAAEKTRKTGKKSTLKNSVSCIDNPDHFRSYQHDYEPITDFRLLTKLYLDTSKS